MAENLFRLIPLAPTQGGYLERGPRIEWSAEDLALPRGGLATPLRVSTVREPTPGGATPVEQVVSVEWEPFDIEGEWTDAGGGPGFAENTYNAVLALVLGTQPVRVEVAAISLVALITRVEPRYFRRDRIAYRITFSPHERVVPGAVSQRSTSSAPAPSAATIASRVTQTSGEVATLQAAHDAVPYPVVEVDSWRGIRDALGALTLAARRLVALVDSPSLLVDDSAAGLGALADAFSAVAVLAGVLLDLARALGPAPAQATYTEARQVELWACSLRTSARRLRALARRSASELKRRIDPEVLAYYRPRRGETLFEVSTRFYDTPFYHALLAERNRGVLRGLLLHDTEELIIPRLGPNAARTQEG